MLVNNPVMVQSFTFNFKEQIAANSNQNNIKISVYMTGLVSTSELVINGYPTNHTYFNMRAEVLSSTNYKITIEAQSTYGDITISKV